MKELIQQAAELDTLFRGKGWRYCFIGGIALQVWGQPRLTRDIDVTLLTHFGQEEAFIDELVGRFASRVEDAAAFALVNRVLLLRNASGTGIDVALGGLAFEESAVDRAADVEFAPGIRLRTCTAEDLLVMKAFASRPRDWEDLRGILVRQGEGGIDWPYVIGHLQPLAELKEEPEILDRLEALRREV